MLNSKSKISFNFKVKQVYASSGRIKQIIMETENVSLTHKEDDEFCAPLLHVLQRNRNSSSLRRVLTTLIFTTEGYDPSSSSRSPQNRPLIRWLVLWYCRGMPSESENQFALTRAVRRSRGANALIHPFFRQPKPQTMFL